MTRLLWPSLFACALLIACGGQTPAPSESSSTPATPANSTPRTSAPASNDTSAVVNTTDAAAAAEEAAQARSSDSAPVTESSGAEQGTAPAAEAPKSESTTAASPATVAEATPAPPVSMPDGPEPTLGVDYTLIDPPQPLSSEPGKVEIAEAFSYTCIHCARFDPLIKPWLATLPAQVHFVQVPMAHGAVEPLARGFYAAQAMGVLEKTHAGMFNAVATEHKLTSGKLDEVARLYSDLGVDGEALKATANSFTVNTQISRNQRTVARWQIETTPTLVVAGKYRVSATVEGGHQGMLRAARWLALKELAQMQPSTP